MTEENQEVATKRNGSLSPSLLTSSLHFAAIRCDYYYDLMSGSQQRCHSN
jgi:hypothetical protein